MFLLYCIFIIFIDQIIKYYINSNLMYGETISIIENFLYIMKINNTGIGFGLFQDKNLLMIGIITIVILSLWYFFRKIYKKNLLIYISVLFIISGALSNLLDRLLHGYIIDYIAFTFWPAFNLADSLIVIGAILLGYYILTNY